MKSLDSLLIFVNFKRIVDRGKIFKYEFKEN